MIYADFITLAVSAFGLGMVSGFVFGSVLRFMRALGHN